MTDSIGELVITRTTGPFEDSITITRADPRITVAAEFLDEIQRRVPQRLDGPPYAEVDGDFLRIRADNRTVVYRLGDEVPGENAYYAEWPD